ncbi:MAG: hypothetical protein J6R32_06305 [Bacteroidales bacterium]|nr:hypothetical protein [Bacteroidales bacterium]
MILETFAFLFGTEGTDRVKKDIKDLKQDTDKVTESNSSLKKGFEELLGVLAPLTAAYAGLRAIMNFANENDQLFQMSQLSGVSARAISELGFAMGEFGGNAQTAAHTIQNLQSQIMQLRRTGSGALLQAGMMYGIGFSTDPTKMMENIARRMQTLNPMMRMDLGRMLGLDNATILMLSKGVKNLREEMERAKRYTFIDEKMVEQAHEFKRTFAEFSAILGGIGIDLATVIMPYAQDIMTFARDSLEYIKKHKFFILEIAAILGTITSGWGAFKLITNPLAQALALITAIAVVGEDIYGYFNGMESKLGEILADSPELKKIVDEIGESVKETWEYVTSGDMYQDIKTEFEKVKKWWDETPLEEKQVQIKAVLSEAWDNIVKKMEEYATEINAIWAQFVSDNKALFNQLGNQLAAFIKPAVDDFKTLGDIIQNGVVNAFKALEEVFKSISENNFFQSIKDFLTNLFNWFGSAWTSISDSFVNSAKAQAYMQQVRTGQVPLQDTMQAMNAFAMNEQANALARQTLYQNTATNNNIRNNNMQAAVTINVQEGSRQTGVDAANGVIDTFGNYATGTR